MADDKLQEKLADYVEDAHAMEQNDLKMIDSIISTTDDPQVKEMCCKATSARPRNTRGACVRG
jgi:ferritin-like metal-binding protein YciE